MGAGIWRTLDINFRELPTETVRKALRGEVVRAIMPCANERADVEPSMRASQRDRCPLRPPRGGDAAGHAARLARVLVRIPQERPHVGRAFRRPPPGLAGLRRYREARAARSP